MRFSRNFRILSIFALMVAAPQVLFADPVKTVEEKEIGGGARPATTTGDSTVASKTYVDNRIPASETEKVLITPATVGNQAGSRSITTAGSGITGLANANATGATNIPTAWAVNQALGNYADQKNAVNGAPLSNDNSVFWTMSDTSGATPIKRVIIDSITKNSEPGMFIIVTPKSTASVGSGLSIHLNSEQDAFPINYKGSTTISNDTAAQIWQAGVPSIFVFNKNKEWEFVGHGVSSVYTAGTGISISSDNVVSNTGVTNVTASSASADDGTIKVVKQGLSADIGVKGWNKTVKYDGTNAVGSATQGVYVNADGTVSAMTHSVNADVPSTAVFTDTVTTVKNSDGTDGASAAADGSVQVTKDGTTTYPVVQGWATMVSDVSGKQDKDLNEVYKVGYNGGWEPLTTALTLDSTSYLTNTSTNSTDGSVKLAIDPTKLADTDDAILNLDENSTEANKSKLTTAWAVNQALDFYDISGHIVNGAPLANAASYFYGDGEGGATSAAKSATITSTQNTALATGMIIVVKPSTSSTTATNLTLNVNQKGAKRITYNGSITIDATTGAKIWQAGIPSIFVYDATGNNNNGSWIFLGHGVDTDTTYTQGDGITISGTTIANAGVRSVTESASTAADGTIAVNTGGTTTNPTVKGWNKTVKYDGTNAVGSATKGVYVNASGVVTEMTHSVNADVPSTAEFTDTTYTFATGTTSGAFTVTPEGGDAQSVSIYGWGDKQDKDNTQTYKVGYNGTWAALGTTLDSNANGYNADNAVTAGTIANALASKEDTSNKLAQGTSTTSVIADNSTSDTKFPTAKAVVNYVTGLGYITSAAIPTRLSAFSDDIDAENTINEITLEGGDSMPVSNKVATIRNFVGTDGTADGKNGLVPAPYKKQTGLVLGSKGTWVSNGVMDVTNSDGSNVAMTTSSNDGSIKVTTGGVVTYPVVRGWSSKENTSNKLTQGTSTTSVIANNSTSDTKFPTAKAVVKYVTGLGYITSADIPTTLSAFTDDIDAANTINTVKVDGTALTIDSNKAVDIPLMGQATGSAAGTVGLVPASSAGDQDKVLTAGRTWAVNHDTTVANSDGSTVGTTTAEKDGSIKVVRDGVTTYPVVRGWSSKQDKDTTQTYKVGYNGGWAALGTTLDPNANGYVATNAVTAETIVNALSGADISGHTVNGAPLSNEATYYYGSGVGGATDTAKTVQINSITTAPTAGMTIVVNPATTATSGASMTLNLNETGAKPVKYDGSTSLTNAKSAAIWKKDVPVVFVYDGTYWLYEGNKYVEGTGIQISGSTITNKGVRSVKNSDNTEGSGSAADGSIRVDTNGTLRYPVVQGWNKTVKYDGTNAVGSATKGVYVNASGVVTEMTHSVNADVPSTAEFTDTTYTFATGTTDGAFTVTPEGGEAQPVSIYGWGNKQNKPATAEVAAGKVLTYNGTGDANGTNNYSAKYIQVPVANNAPNSNGTTVSTLADIWVE